MKPEEAEFLMKLPVKYRLIRLNSSACKCPNCSKIINQGYGYLLHIRMNCSIYAPLVVSYLPLEEGNFEGVSKDRMWDGKIFSVVDSLVNQLEELEE